MVALVLDTSAVSAVMHRVPGALERLSGYLPSEVAISSPVAAEIHFGLERLEGGSRRRALLESEYRRLRDAVEWLDWSEQAAQAFGRIKAATYAAGTPVDDMDLAIASVALPLGARVATLNVRHFARIPGLEVEAWSR